MYAEPLRNTINYMMMLANRADEVCEMFYPDLVIPVEGDMSEAGAIWESGRAEGFREAAGFFEFLLTNNLIEGLEGED